MEEINLPRALNHFICIAELSSCPCTIKRHKDLFVHKLKCLRTLTTKATSSKPAFPQGLKTPRYPPEQRFKVLPSVIHTELCHGSRNAVKPLVTCNFHNLFCGTVN